MSSTVEAVEPSRDERPGLLWNPPGWLLIVLVVLRLSFVIARMRVAPPPDANLIRWVEIAHESGRPYVDFHVEYAPLDLMWIIALGRQGLLRAWVLVHCLAFVCDISTAVLLMASWGRAVATRYLLYGLPLVWLLYARLDLWSVLLATAGIAAIHERRERTGGALVGLAALAKLWPLALLVPVAATRGRRAVVAAAVIVLAGFALWWIFTASAGPSDVLTYRHAEGWSVESTVGAAIWFADGGPAELQEGTWRVGTVTEGPRIALLGLLAITLAAIAQRARSSVRPSGAASLAAVAALTSLSPLYSLQYTAWLLPWAALTEPSESRVLVPFSIAVLSTALIGFVFDARISSADLRVLLLVRALATVGCVVTYLVASKRETSPTATAQML
jgi:hypothetical protein